MLRTGRIRVAAAEGFRDVTRDSGHVFPSVVEIVRAVRSGDLLAEHVVQNAFTRIAADDHTIGAFIHTDDEAVLERARALDERRRRGASLGPLAGVPIAVKDCICTVGAPTTCASGALVRDGAGWRSPYDATVVTRLRKAGAILVGKTNLDEFAMGSSTENSALFPTKNPWDTDRIPGGSSGGSAAAVAAGMVPAALGSDTGGSIRQPAAFTATVGIRPTYGRVSRAGLVAFASSLDQVGPLASDVAGAARLLEIMSGWDPADASSSRQPVPALEQACARDVRGLRIGIPIPQSEEPIDVQVQQCVDKGIDVLRRCGCEIVPVTLPSTQMALAAYYVLAPAEASSNLARFDGSRFGMSERAGASGFEDIYRTTRGAAFGPEVKRRIVLGTFVLSAGYYESYYLRARRVRTSIAAAFADALQRVDAIATPTTPSPPWRLGEKLDDPLSMYLADILTVPASLAGLPAISVPCGWTAAGLPVGLQLMGRAWREDVLCQLASALERRQTKRNHPPLSKQ